MEDDDHQAAEAVAIKVGSRCEVEGGKRGVVRYIGRCEGLPKGWWVGVQVIKGWRRGGVRCWHTAASVSELLGHLLPAAECLIAIKLHNMCSMMSPWAKMMAA